MSDDTGPKPPDLLDTVDADAILRRRDFLVKSAVGLAATAGLAACEESQVCLSIAIPPDADATDGGDADADAEPEVCLSPRPPDTLDGGETDGAEQA